MKRICSALLSIVLCLSLCAPAFAAENQIAPFDAPTQEEYAEAKAYLAAVREHLNVVRGVVMGGTPKTEEEFYAKVREAQASIKAVWTMSAPAFKGMEQAVKRLRSRAEVVLWENIDPYLPLEENSGASPTESGPKRMITWEPAKSSDGITVYRPNIEKAPDFNLDKFWNSFVEEIIPFKEESSSGYTYFLDLEKECAESKNFLTQFSPAFAAEGQAVTVSQSFPEVYIEGTRAGMLDDQWKKRAVLSINGTVYTPLKTAGLWMGAATVWDEAAGTVTITSTGAEPVCYSIKELFHIGAEYAFPGNDVPTHAPDDRGELLHGMTVTLNGQPQSFANALGEPVYPLLFHDCVYLPVRSVAGWLDKQVLWTTAMNRLGEVHIYSAPTREELEGAQTYLDTVRGCLKNVRDVFEGEAPKSQEEFLDKVRTIQSDLKTVWTLPAPDFSGFAPCVDAIRDYAEVTLAMSVDCHLPLEEGSGVPYIGGTPQRIRNYPGRSFSKDWNLLRESMAIDPAVAARENMTTYFMNLEKGCAQAEDFLHVIISAQPTVQ